MWCRPAVAEHKSISFMRRIFLAAVLLLFSWTGLVSAQQTDETLHDENYDFKVKQINDFIERFNGDRYGDFYQFLKSEHPQEFERMGRMDFIKMLFDYSSSIKPETIQKFANYVARNKYKLNLYNDDLYAVLDCDFERRAKPLRIKIALELQSNEDGSAKWVICGVLSKDLDPLKNLDTTKFINPVSHGTDFMGIERIMKDKANLPAYFAENFRPGTIAVFIDEIKKGVLKFVDVNEVKYHIMQIPGWVFEVKQFHRDSKNSGWLISKIIMNNEGDREYYKIKELGIR